MRTGTIGGQAVARIGQGTWQMEHDRARAVDALRAGVDAGMTHIDTAEMYGGGAVESLVGEALVGLRDRVFLASKVLPHNASSSGTARACEASLRRLRTDRLDLYMLHWPGPHPLEQTIAAMERLVEQGKIRHLGVSNFDEDEIEEATRIAGPGRIACNQLCYHLAERHVEQAVIPACERNGVAVVGYSPFGSGRFPSHPLLAEIAARHGATPRQVALAFLSRITLVIPKAASRAHALENAGAADLALAPEEIAAVDAAFPLRVRRQLPII